MHRASSPRRRVAAIDPALLDPPQLVADVSGQLELFGLDCSLQAVPQLGRVRDVRQLGRQRRDVAAGDVARVAVHSAEEITQTGLERLVAVRAPEPTRGAKIGETALAEGAHHRLALGGRHLLVNGLQEIVDLGLRRADHRLDAALRRALLAEMQLSHTAPHYLGERDDSFSLLAQITDHLYDDLIDFSAAQFAALEQ